MKLLSTISLLFFITQSLFSQNIVTVENKLQYPNNYNKEFHKKRHQNLPAGKAGICSVDSLKYSQYKATTTRYISLNSSTSARGYGQYFPVKDSLTLYGLTFYAYAQTFGGSETATCNLYFANALKLPAGAPLATETVTIPWSSSISLGAIKQTVLFSTPITVFYGFVVSLESTTTSGINVATNNWDLNDGASKNYGNARFNNGWALGSNITIGMTTPPTTFDADIFLEPIVSYKIKSNFEPSDESCLGNGEVFKFDNTSTPILNEVFNPLVIDVDNGKSFEWDYGDGSALDNVVHGSNTYTGAGITSYNVTLESEFSGWTMPNTCKDTYVGTIEESDVKARFTSSVNNLNVDFTDTSVDADGWLWDFGDDSTSTEQSPTHTYAAVGNYIVKLIAFAGGCKDSVINTIQVVSTDIEEREEVNQKVLIYPNPANNVLTIEMENLKITDKIQLEMYSLGGQEIAIPAYEFTNGRAQLDLSTINEGNYFLKIFDGRKSIVEKITVLKK